MLSYVLYSLPIILIVFYKLLEPSCKTLKKMTAFYAVFIMFLTLALRQNVGFDFSQYENMFYTDNPTPEPLFLMLHNLFFLFDSHSLFFSFLAFSCLLPVLIVSVHRCSLFILIAYILLPYFYIDSFSIMRQACAIGLCIYGYHLYDHEKKSCWILLAAAAGFHYSSMLFSLALVFLSIRSLSLNTICFLVFISLIPFFPFIMDLMTAYYPKLQFYKGQRDFGYSKVLFNLTIAFISYHLLSTKDAKYIVSLGAIASIPLANIDPVLLRLCGYFFIPLLFINPKIFKCDQKRLFAFSIFLALSFFSFFYSINIKSDFKYNNMVPYQSIL